MSPRFVINALSSAIIQSQARSLTTMDVLIALKDAIESDVRIDGKKKRKWIDFLVSVRKDFYNRWVKEDVHKALFVSFEQEAQDLWAFLASFSADVADGVEGAASMTAPAEGETASVS